MQREDELALVVEEQRGRIALSSAELAQSHIEADAPRSGSTALGSGILRIGFARLPGRSKAMRCVRRREGRVHSYTE